MSFQLTSDSRLTWAALALALGASFAIPTHGAAQEPSSDKAAALSKEGAQVKKLLEQKFDGVSVAPGVKTFLTKAKGFRLGQTGLGAFLKDKNTPPLTELLPNSLVGIVTSLSSLTHFIAFQKGVLDSRDVIYFASLIGFALFMNWVIIRNLRAG